MSDYFEKEDELKMDFTLDALNGPNPFATQAAVHQDVEAALRWQAARSPQQACRQRERIMRDLESEAKEMRCEFVSGFWHALLCCVLQTQWALLQLDGDSVP